MSAIQAILPFTFGLRVNEDGSCSTPVDTQETVFPLVKNRRLWNEDFPEVAFYPEAIGLIHEMHPETPMTREECNDLLEFHKFPRMNQGNWTHACDQGLITQLTVKRFSRKHPKGVALYSAPIHGSRLNQLAFDQVLWALDSGDNGVGLSDPTDKLQWIQDFAKTLEQKGAQHFESWDDGLPF